MATYLRVAWPLNAIEKEWPGDYASLNTIGKAWPVDYALKEIKHE
jgi:hypothetical protein